MWPNVPSLAGLLLAALLGLAGCDAPPPVGTDASNADIATPIATPIATSEDTLELGRKVYNFRCYFCHGYSGDARTLAASYLNPKPRDFSATAPASLARSRMLGAVRDGRDGTAMKGFAGILDEREIAAVTDFVRNEFMLKRAPNTRYHTPQNGWPDHERNRLAFAFARGEIAIDTPWEQLDQSQQRGKRLFMAACITCHDHGRVVQAGAVWESRPLTYPRDAYCTSCHEEAPRSAATGAGHPQPPKRPATHTFARPDGSVPLRSPRGSGKQDVANAYLVHDVAPVLHKASAAERQGELLFQKNCAFCHAADGTSKGWIGSFLDPHPRDLTSRSEMQGMTRARLARAIADGLSGTSMPAWKGVLSAAEIDALTAYIARAFQPALGVTSAEAK